MSSEKCGSTGSRIALAPRPTTARPAEAPSLGRPALDEGRSDPQEGGRPPEEEGGRGRGVRSGQVGHAGERGHLEGTERRDRPGHGVAPAVLRAAVRPRG